MSMMVNILCMFLCLCRCCAVNTRGRLPSYFLPSVLLVPPISMGPSATEPGGVILLYNRGPYHYSFGGQSAEAEPRRCVYYKNATSVTGLPDFGVHLGEGHIRCNACCHAIWTESSSTRQVLFQGCLQENIACQTETCEVEKWQDTVSPGRLRRYTLLQCSCSTDLCNRNFSQPYHMEKSSKEGLSWPVCVLVALSPLILLGLAIVVWKKQRGHGLLCVSVENVSRSLELSQVMQSLLPEPVSADLSSLHFSQVLHRGKSAVVWMGTFQGQHVAIKEFQDSCRKKYLNEWRVLCCMAPMDHENVVRFIAVGCNSSGQKEMAHSLILQYHPAGCLKSFLIQYTSDWDGTLCIAVSLARGLAFLHDEIWKDGYHKPSIAHRDLTSQNVLVKVDGTCAISDFDLALMLSSVHMGWGQDADGSHIPAVGTLRYMSPEILDGSGNLKGWKATLKQADVYSLGLVLWETFSRCSSFYSGESAVPEFRMVFEAELGRDPSYVDLRTLILEERRRPVLPDIWKEVPEIYQSVWETLDDCWDSDAEARLTAMCAEQRLHGLIGSRIPRAQH